MKTILLLEDESSFRGLFRWLLQGYAIVEATTAQQGTFGHRDQRIDLLIADTPIIGSGIRVALEMRSLIPDLRVILVSRQDRSKTADTAALGAFPSGSAVVLKKPFFPAVLLDRVHELIGEPMSRAAAAV